MAIGETHHTLERPTFDRAPKILIVVAPYYKDIADQLVKGAEAEIEACGGFHETIQVPGALEVPTAIGIAERMSNFDGYVALGCVIRGETTHYDTVCNDSSRALTLLGLQGLCIGNGILTVENYKQAEVRAEAAGQNKGGGAAAAALHLIALARKWGGPRSGVGFTPARDEYQIASAGKGPTVT
ncbi:6,7-dimethyl-8-ribityllumazine synthase [Tropicibacter naphthalenivorans]|uniref:6,7-dimethyl-8-ribityllumazine synthase n=1 Tax=Tropicibacter naphthalenivorans TaxID=441103 RepID=A0A0P1G212_9RHOB|nr:6,7-dimethyl-8-ribityllumazine synthase [Tropicibacter naphthalenivorans]CUH75845.1 6,7-dimethyl-8-ribityllumazine synthase 1 [Tropicibacter naphthalenivorans]SMC41881.1 6,7-dimethyl-8-ribityllumazine synthase [Tropicibacter naphthalenivorans]